MSLLPCPSRTLTSSQPQKRVTEAKAIYEDCLTQVESLATPTPPCEHHTRVMRCTEGVGKCWFLLGDFQVSCQAAFSPFVDLRLRFGCRILTPYALQRAEELVTRALRMCTAQQQQQEHKSLASADASLAAERQRAYRNVAMVAIAKKSALAVEGKLQR